MTQESNKWVTLVEQAVKDDKAIVAVYAEIDATLRSIARNIASQLVDDAVQEAKVKIWQKIGSVDTSRPATIKAVIIRIGVNAMRDEVRKYLRRTDGDTVQTINDDYDGPTANYTYEEQETLGPFLDQYVMYIRKADKMEGSHKAIAKKMNLPVEEVIATFKKEVCRVFKVKLRKIDGEDDEKIYREIVAKLRKRRLGSGR